MVNNPPAAGPVSNEGMKLPFAYKTLHHYQSHNIADAGLGTGVPVFIALGVAGSEEVGIQIGASGDEIYFRELLTSFMFLNRAEDIQARIWFEAANAGDTAIDWTLAVKGEAAGELGTDAAASPDGSITYAAHTSTVGTQSTEWAALAVGGLFTDDDWLKLVVTCTDIGTASANELFFQALELRYTMSLEAAAGVQELT